MHLLECCTHHQFTFLQKWRCHQELDGFLRPSARRACRVSQRLKNEKLVGTALHRMHGGVWRPLTHHAERAWINQVRGNNRPPHRLQRAAGWRGPRGASSGNPSGWRCRTLWWQRCSRCRWSPACSPRPCPPCSSAQPRRRWKRQVCWKRRDRDRWTGSLCDSCLFKMEVITM